MIAGVLLLSFLVQNDPSDAVRRFVYGTGAEHERAREEVAALGSRAIPLLLELRPRVLRPEALDALVFRIKVDSAGEKGRPFFEKLTKARITVDMQNAPPTAILDYFREMLGFNLVLDPGLDRELPELSLTLADAPFRTVLETLTSRTGLDYDVRSGVLFLAEPKRLWATGPAPIPRPLTEAQTLRARELLAELGSDSPKARDQATGELRKLGPEVAPLLKEAAG
ncbi:MAG TPA: hypothetical protein VEN81_08815, partial [Planctomycetota bacterium]|nr:hypothetical protein [Planctomycetota bacterium]